MADEIGTYTVDVEYHVKNSVIIKVFAASHDQAAAIALKIFEKEHTMICEEPHIKAITKEK